MPTDARTKELGRRGEQLAAEHLERLGYRVLDRNYRTRHGELDLVLTDEDEEFIVFCEVKTRRLGSGAPFDALNDPKRLQVRRVAVEWLAGGRSRPYWAELRFDAVGVTLDARDELVRLDHLEGAF